MYAVVFRASALAGLTLGLCAGLAVHAQQAESPETIVFEALRSTYDGATGRSEVIELQLSQGDMSIEADRASTEGDIQFDRSDWRLEGNVRIRKGAVQITADTAEFVARDGVLERFELRGSPARFEDLEPATAERAYGEAERLVYDAVETTVALLGDARFMLGTSEYIGCDWVYNLDSESVRSGSSECERPFQIRITPGETGGGSRGDP